MKHTWSIFSDHGIFAIVNGCLGVEFVCDGDKMTVWEI